MSNTQSIPISNSLHTMGLLIEKRLGELIPEDQKLPYHSLYQAARYSLLGGGKRLRPLIALAVNEMLGGTTDQALSAACALEMLHTYSLIHDDLPCMDNDDFRRGKPSLHKAYSEGLAVLAGDFLLTHAFDVLANDPLLSSPQKIALIQLLAKASGGDGMIAGQVLDIHAEKQLVDLDYLQLTHSKKTGALISASFEFGGVIAETSNATMHLLRRLGNNLGLVFQIIDDILDVTSSQQKHGKAIGSDQANHKKTYVTLLGLDRAKMEAEKLHQDALQLLDQLPGDSSLLKKLAQSITVPTGK